MLIPELLPSPTKLQPLHLTDSYPVLQMNFTISAYILCTHFNVFKSPTMFCICFTDIKVPQDNEGR